MRVSHHRGGLMPSSSVLKKGNEARRLGREKDREKKKGKCGGNFSFSNRMGERKCVERTKTLECARRKKDKHRCSHLSACTSAISCSPLSSSSSSSSYLSSSLTIKKRNVQKGSQSVKKYICTRRFFFSFSSRQVCELSLFEHYHDGSLSSFVLSFFILLIPKCSVCKLLKVLVNL